MTSVDPSSLVVAGGRMTGVRCYIDVDPDELLRALAPLGAIELLAPAGRQVCCELWRLTRGHVLVGGLERERWVEMAGELGRSAASFWGPRISREWGSLLERQAAAMTRWMVIEPYHELLFSVPDVRYPGCEEPVSVALGMATDLPLAFHIDHIAWYGYDKRLGTFATDGAHSWDVSVEGELLLSARLEPTGRTGQDFDRAAAASGAAQPLLGGLRENRPMVAELRHDLADCDHQLEEVEGTIELTRGHLPLDLTGRHAVRSRGAPPNRISLGFKDVEAFVTYPRPVG